MIRARLLTALGTAWLLTALGLTAAPPAYSGGLIFLEAEFQGVGGVDGIEGATSAAVSPDGKNVYATGKGSDAVAVFTRDGTTGTLTFLEAKFDGVGGVDGLNKAQGVAVSPDGKNVYVTGQVDDAVAVFTRDGTTGALTFLEAQFDGVGGVDGLNGAEGVAVSPGGEHVYVAGRSDDAVAVFSRDGTTGALTFSSMASVSHPVSLALSPDGKHVYVGATSQVTVFSRNGTTGALTLVEDKTDDTAGVDGIGGRSSVAVSPDGKHVYATGSNDNAVAAFSRDGTTGALTFVEAKFDGVGGVDGLKASSKTTSPGPSSVAVSPDGMFVYVAGQDDDAVAVFRRNATTGALTFIEAKFDGADGVTGIKSASGVAASADGKHLYATGRDPSSVAVFGVDTCGNGILGVDEQCDDMNMTGGDGCSTTCQLELCGATPATTCRKPTLAEKSLILLKNNADDGADKLVWKWTFGEATPVADYGDPTATASYLLCLYDMSGGSQPLLTFAAPSGGSCLGQPCWQAPNTTSFKYKDKLGTPNGLSFVKLQEGLTNGEAKILVKGKSFHLGLPSSVSLNFTLPVTLQLLNTQTSVCWEAEYSTFLVKEADQFKARSDAP
jgi:cysteine-rich repeat protein